MSAVTSDASTKYHTVTICRNLSKGEKNYPCNKLEDLPPADYWKKLVEFHSKSKLGKSQHIMSNGPRES